MLLFQAGNFIRDVVQLKKFLIHAALRSPPIKRFWDKHPKQSVIKLKSKITIYILVRHYLGSFLVSESFTKAIEVELVSASFVLPNPLWPDMFLER